MRDYFFWAFILVSLPLIIKRPYWGVIIYIVLNIVRPEMIFWGGGSGSSSLKIILVATTLGIVANNSNLNFNEIFNRELVLLFCLFIGLRISICFSEYSIERVDYYVYEILKLWILCFFIFLTINSTDKILLFQRFTLGAIVVLGLWGIEQHFLGNTRLEGLGGKSFGDSNAVASLFVLYFPIAFVFFIESENVKHKLLYGFASIAIVLLIVFTKSRGGFLAIMAAVIYCILQSDSKKKYLIWVLVVLFCAIPFVGEQYIKRLNTLKATNTDTMEGSGKSRLYLWTAGIYVFLDNPVFGTGFMTYPQAKLNYEHKFDCLDAEFREWVFRKENPKVTHNTYIQMLSDSGLVGSTPYFLLISGVFVFNRRLRKQMDSFEPVNKDALTMLRAMESGIAGFCVSIIFIDSITFIFLPIQIVASACLRNCIYRDSDAATSRKNVID